MPDAKAGVYMLTLLAASQTIIVRSVVYSALHCSLHSSHRPQRAKRDRSVAPAEIDTSKTLSKAMPDDPASSFDIEDIEGFDDLDPAVQRAVVAVQHTLRMAEAAAPVVTRYQHAAASSQTTIHRNTDRVIRWLRDPRHSERPLDDTLVKTGYGMAVSFFSSWQDGCSGRCFTERFVEDEVIIGRQSNTARYHPDCWRVPVSGVLSDVTVERFHNTCPGLVDPDNINDPAQMSIAHGMTIGQPYLTDEFLCNYSIALWNDKIWTCEEIKKIVSDMRTGHGGHEGDVTFHDRPTDQIR